MSQEWFYPQLKNKRQEAKQLNCPGGAVVSPVSPSIRTNACRTFATHCDITHLRRQETVYACACRACACYYTTMLCASLFHAHSAFLFLSALMDPSEHSERAYKSQPLISMTTAKAGCPHSWVHLIWVVEKSSIIQMEHFNLLLAKEEMGDGGAGGCGEWGVQILDRKPWQPMHFIFSQSSVKKTQKLYKFYR